jgi:uncharacterized protein (DUF2141 family)
MLYRILVAAGGAGLIALGAAATAQELDVTTAGSQVQGNAVVFSGVTIDQDGYVVVHAVENGSPVVPSSLGSAAVAAGQNTDVAVPVAGLAAGDYVAMLHHETNGNQTYDFGEGSTDVDTPAMGADGSPYAVPFSIGQM